MTIYRLYTGVYLTPDYRYKDYTSLHWFEKKLKALNYPFKNTISGANWNHFGINYKIEIWHFN